MQFIGLLQKHWLSLVLATVLTSGAALGLSFLFDQLYSSEINVLVVQRTSADVDSYAAGRAAERVAANLVKVVPTSDILQRVLDTGYVDRSFFAGSSEDNKKMWEKLATAETVSESGMIHITGYGLSAGQAEDIALGISQVLVTDSSDYHGGGESVQLKQVDGPITSERPVKPNLILNALAGAVIGFAVTYAIHALRFEMVRVRTTNDHLSSHALQPMSSDTVVPLAPQNYDVQYKVLDQFQAQPFIEAAPTTMPSPAPAADEPVAMPEHLKE